jgi:hypothetical protein
MQLVSRWIEIPLGKEIALALSADFAFIFGCHRITEYSWNNRASTTAFGCTISMFAQSYRRGEATSKGRNGRRSPKLCMPGPDGIRSWVLDWMHSTSFGALQPPRARQCQRKRQQPSDPTMVTIVDTAAEGADESVAREESQQACEQQADPAFSTLPSEHGDHDCRNSQNSLERDLREWMENDADRLTARLSRLQQAREIGRFQGLEQMSY